MNMPKNSPYYPVFSKLTVEESTILKDIATKLCVVIYDEWCQYRPTCSVCEHRKQCHTITNFTDLLDEHYQELFGNTR